MKNRVIRTFLAGLFAFLPLAISVYILFWMTMTLESIANKFLLWYLPDFLYVPGMGILLGIILIFLLGALLTREGARSIYEKIEAPFTYVPLVKSIYFAIKDLSSYLAPNEEKKKGQVVKVKIPGSEIQMVGLVTRKTFTDLPPGLQREGVVCVYFPMSYQLGGFTMFVPKDWIEPLDLDVESMMRMVLTAWMPSGSAKRGGTYANVQTTQSGDGSSDLGVPRT